MSFRRALTAATATVVASAALVTGSTAPAAAYEYDQNSRSCPEASSIKLLTLNYEAEKLWIYQYDASTVFVCWKAGASEGGVLIFEAGTGGGLVPSVVRDPDPSDCVPFLTVNDPVDASVQFQWTAPVPPFYFCFGVNGTAVGVTVASTGPANPDVDHWFDAGSVLCGHFKGSYCYVPYQVF